MPLVTYATKKIFCNLFDCCNLQSGIFESLNFEPINVISKDKFFEF